MHRRLEWVSTYVEDNSRFRLTAVALRRQWQPSINVVIRIGSAEFACGDDGIQDEGIGRLYGRVLGED